MSGLYRICPIHLEPMQCYPNGFNGSWKCLTCQREQARERRRQRVLPPPPPAELCLCHSKPMHWIRRADLPHGGHFKCSIWFEPVRGIRRSQWAREREERLWIQKGICAAPGCDEPATQLDHDHTCCRTTSKRACGRCYRGMVCGRCNTILGAFESRYGGDAETLMYVRALEIEREHPIRARHMRSAAGYLQLRREGYVLGGRDLWGGWIA